MQVTELPAQDSVFLQAGFVALSLAMAAFLAWWSKRAWWVLAWTGLTAAGALTGIFGYVVLPPPALLVMFFGAVVATRSLVSGSWRELSLKLLIGFQAFRVLVELLIHRAVQEGVAPPQMTWTGLNFDVVAGASAALLWPFTSRLPRWALLAWNFFGLALLCNVVGVAILSMPLPFQQFRPDSVWVLIFPYQWLPMILVLSAYLGHIALFRRLRTGSGGDPHDVAKTA